MVLPLAGGKPTYPQPLWGPAKVLSRGIGGVTQEKVLRVWGRRGGRCWKVQETLDG